MLAWLIELIQRIASRFQRSEQGETSYEADQWTQSFKANEEDATSREEDTDAASESRTEIVLQDAPLIVILPPEQIIYNSRLETAIRTIQHMDIQDNIRLWGARPFSTGDPILFTDEFKDFRERVINEVIPWLCPALRFNLGDIDKIAWLVASRKLSIIIHEWIDKQIEYSIMSLA